MLSPSIPPRLIPTLLLCGTALVSARPAAAQQPLNSFVQPALQDVTAKIKIVSKNGAALKKVDKSAQQAYQLSSREVWCKEPGLVRFQGKKGLTTVRYVTRGDKRLLHINFPPVRKVEDVSKEPNKADTISDLGVITRSWVDLVEDKWLRTEKVDGKSLQVYQYFYKGDKRAKHTIWVDPTTKTIVDHIAHHRAKKRPGFKKRLVYREVKQINGVWLPTRVELFNSDNELAAVMQYESIKVNSNLSDKLFSF
jgi:hypothetical protein